MCISLYFFSSYEIKESFDVEVNVGLVKIIINEDEIKLKLITTVSFY